jgi:hypothetical protein
VFGCLVISSISYSHISLFNTIKNKFSASIFFFSCLKNSFFIFYFLKENKDIIGKKLFIFGKPW